MNFDSESTDTILTSILGKDGHYSSNYVRANVVMQEDLQLDSAKKEDFVKMKEEGMKMWENNQENIKEMISKIIDEKFEDKIE